MSTAEEFLKKRRYLRMWCTYFKHWYYIVYSSLLLLLLPLPASITLQEFWPPSPNHSTCPGPLLSLPDSVRRRSFTSFSTPSIHIFRGLPVSNLALSWLLHLNYCILWLFMNSLIVTILNSSVNSWSHFLRHWPVPVSMTGPHILLQISFSNVFGLFVALHW